MTRSASEVLNWISVFDDSIEVANNLSALARKHRKSDPNLSYWLAEAATHIHGMWDRLVEDAAALGLVREDDDEDDD